MIVKLYDKTDDAHPEYNPKAVEVNIEGDGLGISLEAQGPNGLRVADVYLEHYEGKLTLRWWLPEDLECDPSGLVDLLNTHQIAEIEQKREELE